MKKIVTTFALGLFMTISLCAQEDARWIRKSSISPDGSTIVFSYKGDLFTVPSTGGTALRICSNAAYDSDPVWCPDGKNIVFSSYREGSKDIWIVPSVGGKARQLTDFPGAETPLFVSRDNQVYFSANIQADASWSDFPGTPQLYSVNIKDKKLSLISSVPMMNGSVNVNGIILYEDYKGYEDNLRKHHVSSVTRDVWKYLPKKNQYQKLSDFIGEDRNPVFAADGKDYFYLSERSGSFNVWKANINSTEAPSQITRLTTHPVRNLSVSMGNMLCFSYNGDLYTCLPGDPALKVNIKIVSDDNEREQVYRNISSGATELAVSPNGKEIAIVAHGDVFVIAPDQKVTKRITNTPSQERGISFSKDGRSLYYAAERDGYWGIYKAELTGEDYYFAFSYNIKESLFTKAGQTCFQPQVSPDGKWVAFLRNRTELVVKGTVKGEEKSLLKGVNYSYSDGDQFFEWCPDSHHLLVNYIGNGGWNNEDIALVNIDNEQIVNLTQSGYSDYAFRWALDGKAMIWQTDKYGYRSHGSWGAESNIFAMFFDNKAYYEFTRSKDDDSIDKLLTDKKKEIEKEKAEKEAAKKKKKDKEKKDTTKKVEDKALELLLDGREDRIVCLTPAAGRIGDSYLSKDGKKLYYFQRLESGSDLLCRDIKEKEVKVIRKDFRGSFYPSADGKTLFILGNGISKMDVASGKIESVNFSSNYDYQAAKEREYIFNHVCKQVEEKFYDEKLHGLDWKAMQKNYKQFLPHINNNFDFQDLLSELLGELNASHTGARYRAPRSTNTGYLGILFDMNYKGKGLKIAELLPGNPVSLVDPSIAPGDLIMAVDGVEIPEGANWYDALKQKAGKRVLLKIKKNKTENDIFVTTLYSNDALLYKRWVRQREEITENLSKGRVGYVHVQGMDSESFREVYSKLLGKYRNCEAVVVDTRHNGGGWLHDDLATLLNGKAYAEFRPRGQYIGTDPFNKWTKPSCVLIGEDNYSDACGFPYVYRSLGIGKLIGAPVPGTMTAVWWEQQIDPTLVFGIPQVTCWGLNENRAIENMQIEPDITVYNTAESILRGEDLQLETAVKEMLKELDAKKKK